MNPERSDGPRRLEFSVFCGGRGSAALIHELMRHSDIHVNLLVNAYDDGLSTGELRDFVPGMLGPSDFRKNLARLLDIFSSDQHLITRLLEYRLPADLTNGESVLSFFHSDGSEGHLPPELAAMFEQLDPQVRVPILKFLKRFAEYSSSVETDLTLADCSLGNLIFAGAYLDCGEDFNQTTAKLSALFHSKASLINITGGDNRILVALKEDGEVLERESRVVGPQSPVPIERIFLLSEPLDEEDLSLLKAASRADRVRLLEERCGPVLISPEAERALQSSDVIVFGSGTQHSSMFPSYVTHGVPEAILASKARVRALIANIGPDHDIQSLTATGIVDAALLHLGDPENERGLLTHVLATRVGEEDGDRIPIDHDGPTYKSARWLVDDLQNENLPGEHSGIKLAGRLISLYERERLRGAQKMEIFACLEERSFVTSSLVQEYLDLPWSRVARSVLFKIQARNWTDYATPPHLELVRGEESGLFPEVEIFRDWLTRGDSEYLATITGDGRYRLSDILTAIRFMQGNSFGATFGSRNQKRTQFLRSTSAAYGNSKLLLYLSWVASFVLGAVFSVRFKLFFSDPLTGFRIYRRSRIVDRISCDADLRELATPSDITKLLVRSSVDIAEIPVEYWTFKGFTSVGRRLIRGGRNALSILTR